MTCTRGDHLASVASYPPLQVRATPTLFATAVSINTARVTVAGDANNANNVALDPTSIR